MLIRQLKLQLPKGKSAFLWGPRQSGKTTFLKKLFPKAVFFDFLLTDLYIEMVKTPSLLRERLLSIESSPQAKFPVILDEVQKVPQLMDEVHWLIENTNFHFILSGSSARKLKRGNANMLGGRAWQFHLFPLTFREIKSFDLLRALNHGLLPTHYLEEEYHRSLKSYINNYLKEEIKEEGLTRNLPAFARFLDALAFTHGELVNYSNLSRDCGVDAKTVKEFFQIMEDTLLGTLIYPWSKRTRKDSISSMPKFYLFDVGIAGKLTNRCITQEKGIEFGRAFEHYLLMELLAHRSYTGLDYKIQFWRSKNGQEIDFILGDGQIALEIKGSSRVDKKELHALNVYMEECPSRKAIVICNESQPRKIGKLLLLPWKEFLEQLWDGKIIG